MAKAKTPTSSRRNTANRKPLGPDISFIGDALEEAIKRLEEGRRGLAQYSPRPREAEKVVKAVILGVKLLRETAKIRAEDGSWYMSPR